MNRYVLDTNTCTEYLRQSNERLVRRIRSKRKRQIRVCSVVVGELYDGVYRSADIDKNLALLHELLETFASLPFDDQSAQIFGEMRVKLDALGTPIGPLDLQIASIALAHGLIVVTHNVREFSRVPGLMVEDWEI